MFINRFKFFIHSIRLDNYRGRAASLQNDRLVAISEVWNKLASNLRRFYVPEDTLTVDEQLASYRGTIPGRTCISSKPRKYGVKIFWLCEAKSSFPLNANIYVGKVFYKVHRNLGKDVVLELCQTTQWIWVGCWDSQTSYSLAVALTKVNLTLLGTIRCNRKEIPIELHDKKRQIKSSKFAFDHENHIILSSYILQKNKNIILLSSSNSGMQTVPEKANKSKLMKKRE